MYNKTMNWLIAALLAAFINGISAVFDKKLLGEKGISDPLVYTFWVGILSVLALLLLPFGFVAIPVEGIIFSLVTGVIFIFALFVFFTTLHKFSATDVLPMVGGLTPIAALLLSSAFLEQKIGIGNSIGFVILVSGAFVFLFTGKPEFRLKTLSLALVSALLFGFSLIFKKIAFGYGPFIPIFIWISAGGVIFSLILLNFPKFRARILNSSGETRPKHKIYFLLNRGLAASAAIAVNYAIFLGHPAIVESVMSFKYVVIFIAARILVKEKFYGKLLFGKIAGMILIIFGLAWLSLVQYILAKPTSQNMEWGVTFSEKYAKELSRDNWRKMYTDILDELGARHLRLIAYWDLVEPEDNKFEFNDLDWQISEAQKRGAEIILALGRKAPRWPECHEPDWAKNLTRSDLVKYQDALLNYIQATILRYKNNHAIKSWQVENEPFFPFGTCKTTPLYLLNREISLVKSLDNRPVALTDSGELGFAWPFLAVKSDVFGTTLYRYIHNKVFGSIRYSLIPPEFFQLKKLWASDIFGKNIFIAELQGEPWPPQPMNKAIFGEVADYAKASGFPIAYWWGVEWWHSELMRGRPEMWETAKKLFKQ